MHAFTNLYCDLETLYCGLNVNLQGPFKKPKSLSTLVLFFTVIRSSRTDDALEHNLFEHLQSHLSGSEILPAIFWNLGKLHQD
jgi:hypothetical protein